MTDRREFVRDAALLGAAFAFPGAEWLRAPRPRAADPARLAAWDGPADEEYWQLVRSQFLLSPRGLYFNTGTIGASPRPVVAWSPNWCQWVPTTNGFSSALRTYVRYASPRAC